MGDADDLQTVEIGSSRLQATFVPGAGMVCASLRHDALELLAQRAGVLAYARRGTTMGIPLLYPWANRLADSNYPGPRGDVQLAPENPLLRFDANGLPIHGALPGGLPWELIETPACGGESLHARLLWQRPDLLAIFPFEHELLLDASITGPTLTLETTVRARGDAPFPVPVSFGYHPYLTLPRIERSEWLVELPVMRRLLLDERMIPTGLSESFDARSFALADGDWDDAFAAVADPAVFAVSGAGQRIELEFREGYSHAQVYSPAGERFICFEPMTAPSNALISRAALPVVAPGEAYAAAFTLTVRDDR